MFQLSGPNICPSVRVASRIVCILRIAEVNVYKCYVQRRDVDVDGTLVIFSQHMCADAYTNNQNNTNEKLNYYYHCHSTSKTIDASQQRWFGPSKVLIRALVENFPANSLLPIWLGSLPLLQQD